MEFSSKFLEQIAFNRAKIEGYILIVMDESIHEGHLSQPLQTNSKQFKTASTFFAGYNGIFNITSTNEKLLYCGTNQRW